MPAPTTLVIPTIGDLHWGAPPPDELARELDEVVFPWLEANHFDALIQLGDYYDRRLALDSADSKAAFKLAVRLCQLCHSRGVPFRILKGTGSHDFQQLDNLRPLETEYPGFRVVADTLHEELLPGFDVLWMPELYPADYAAYYSPFFFDEGGALVYDAIFGHGEIDVAASWGEGGEGERRYGGTPTHSAELLLEHSSGPVWFGHVHKRFRHKRIGYPGSFTRWCQGEEADKGFDVLTLTQKAGATGWAVSALALPNALAPVYRTVAAEEILLPGDAPDEILRKIRAEAAPCRRLRVKVGGYALGVEELSIIRGALAEDHGVDLQLAARPPEAQQEVLEEGAEEATAAARADLARRLDYLRDQTLPTEERLLRHIQETNPAVGVTLEDVRELTAPPAESVAAA